MIIQAKVTNHTYKIMTDAVKDEGNGRYSAFGQRWIETKKEWAKSKWFHFTEYSELKICDADGSLVDDCKGASCKSHNRCCWQ